ncbi:reverse transcriptase [Gossypium australe]|uniref:Reverse transcriptase n=1 Tax=Gossypium australe TaxID=47621 RepID=A0A5B6V4D9_9ROSI|nr:reverse transcriptase [Gossypium australe]KAA3463931.1 reverse transcriptase [Gossypium australe]
MEPLNATNIVLIPKIDQTLKVENYRPISLCMVLYRIISKTIANHYCIDKAQNAFVPRYMITDNVLLAFEILNSFKHKRTSKKCSLALKLDMSKTYDRCISTVSYSMVINGIEGQSFKPTRGLR